MLHEHWFRSRQILRFKDQVIIPDDVENAVPESNYSEAYKGRLDDLSVFPLLEVLAPLMEKEFVLLPTPTRRMSAQDIGGIMPELFASAEAFACADTTEPGWIAIEKAPSRKSFGLPWDKQLALVDASEDVPNIAELAWFLGVFRRFTQVHLLSGIRVRTSSLCGDEKHLIAGYYQGSGLQLFTSLFDGFGATSTGILRCRRFPLAAVH